MNAQTERLDWVTIKEMGWHSFFSTAECIR
jgi:hypothetical protein